MLKKILSITFVIFMFVISSIYFVPHDKVYKITQVNSPVSFEFGDKNFYINDLDTFDSSFTSKNRDLANKIGISEQEAFILGNLSKYWASNLMKGRKVFIKNDNLVYYRYSYRSKFLYSGFCLKNGKPYYKEAFDKKLAEIRRAKYKVMDLETENIYEIEDDKVRSLNNFILIRKSHIQKPVKNHIQKMVYESGNVKIHFADSTTKLKPDRNCSSSICQEILTNINKAQSTIDMAIYGYSATPKIEEALKSAMNRGVKIRMIYDLDSKGENIYPDTSKLVSIIPNSKNDGKSVDAKNIMHNKFYIFDNKVLITGSANLSHTDMSGFNSNSIVVINSSEVAKIYKNEFEQMFSGKFHSEKISLNGHRISLSGTEMDIYFSPQDKSITNAVLPLIRNAKKYIYIPTFVLTEKRVTEELIKAKQRGVDVKIIIDALNASIKHSKHKELRLGGILVKTENYAGKMHSKSMIIDDEYTIIGSMNFSYSGENKNDENLIVIKNTQIAKFYKEFFLYQWNRIDDKWLKLNARAEGKDSIGSCSDGLDNNYDGLIDKDDLACK